MGKGFHTSNVIDCGGLKINGTEVIGSTGAITAATGSIGEAELATGAVTSDKIAANTITSADVNKDMIQSAVVTILPTNIVGTDAGDIGHTAGAVLVASPGPSATLEFVSATLVYSYDTAAYTGGGDDLVIRQGTTAMTAPIAKADLLADTEDDIAYVNALSAADIKLTADSTLNLYGTAYTNPGTAAGILTVYITYRVHNV